MIVIGAVSYEAAQIVYHSDIKQNQIITGGSMNNGIFILLSFWIQKRTCILAINLHYTLGHDIYIGWITGCFAIGGAVVTICSSMGTPDEEEEDNEVDIEAVRQNHYKECFDV